MVQVAGLVQGYKAMGQGLTQLQGDVSVQLVMNADQLAQMNTLNTAWDSWLKLVEAGPAAYNALEQGIATLNTDMAAAGATFGGTNAASLTLQASFQSLVPQMGATQDAIRQYSAVLQNGAAGSAMLVQATKDMIASSGLLNTTNQQVRNGLIAVAEEADPSVNTWQKLTQWIGPLGAAGATADLNKIMTQLQTPLTNLQQDAAEADHRPAAGPESGHGPGRVHRSRRAAGFRHFRYRPAEVRAGQPGDHHRRQDRSRRCCCRIDKNSGTAKDQFVAWGESMGLTGAQATRLWGQVSAGAKPLASVQAGLAASATAGQDLAASGFWGQVRDKILGTMELRPGPSHHHRLVRGSLTSSPGSPLPWTRRAVSSLISSAPISRTGRRAVTRDSSAGSALR